MFGKVLIVTLGSSVSNAVLKTNGVLMHSLLKSCAPVMKYMNITKS